MKSFKAEDEYGGLKLKCCNTTTDAIIRDGSEVLSYPLNPYELRQLRDWCSMRLKELGVDL